MPFIRSFTGDVLPVSIHIGYGYEDTEALSKGLHKKRVLPRSEVLPPREGANATCYFLADAPIAIIALWQNISVGVIAHEAVHAASYFCEVLGISTNHDEDEPMAYLVQWVVENTLKVPLEDIVCH